MGQCPRSPGKSYGFHVKFRLPRWLRRSKSTPQESSLVDAVDCIVSPNLVVVGGVKSVAGSNADENPKIWSESQSTPTENLLADAVDCEIISPQLAKSMSEKRFKFSPGMLIKQSQDDGGDEITWKISPVNERLHSISKNLPEVVKALAEVARSVTSNLKRCSNDTKGSPRSGKSLQLRNRVSLNIGTPREDFSVCNGDRDLIDVKILGVVELQSPFRTPPSLPYCHNKVRWRFGAGGEGLPVMASSPFRGHQRCVSACLVLCNFFRDQWRCCSFYAFSSSSSFSPQTLFSMLLSRLFKGHVFLFMQVKSQSHNSINSIMEL